MKKVTGDLPFHFAFALVLFSNHILVCSLSGLCSTIPSHAAFRILFKSLAAVLVLIYRPLTFRSNSFPVSYHSQELALSLPFWLSCSVPTTHPFSLSSPLFSISPFSLQCPMASS